MNYSLNYDPARLSQMGFLKTSGVDTDAKIAALVDNLVYDWTIDEIEVDQEGVCLS